MLGVKELPKPPGEACAHLAPQGGCAIWGDHPASCKTFTCLWRRPEATLPDSMFPGLCGFLLALDQDATWPTVVKVCSARGADRAWDAPAYRAVFARLAAAWNCAVVVMGHDGRAELAFAPSGRVFEPAVNPEVFPLDGRALALPEAEYDADRRPPAARIAE